MGGIESYVNQIHVGDVLPFVKNMPDNSIDCILFSPPY